MSGIEICVICKKRFELPYYEASYHGMCDSCAKEQLSDYKCSLGDTTGVRSAGEDYYGYESTYYKD